jgi:transposase-like protein
VYVSKKRDTGAATRFFTAAIGARGEPAEVTTDRAPTLARAIEDLLPDALHDTGQYANNVSRLTTAGSRHASARCAA